MTESDFVTPLCITNNPHDRWLDMFVVPQMTSFARTFPHDSWIRKGVRLHRLSDSYATVKKCWAERSDQEIVNSRQTSRPKLPITSGRVSSSRQVEKLVQLAALAVTSFVSAK